MTRSNDDIREQLYGLIADYADQNHGYRFDPEHPKLRLHEPTFSTDEIFAALDVLLTTHVTMGEKVKGFERDYAAYFGYKNGVFVNSGSSANLLALATLVNPECRDGLKPGDEVIVPALSWSTTVWPVIQCGLVPVVVDIDPETLNIDPNAAEAAIGPKTRGLMPVHVYGNPCDMDALTDICTRHHLVLIEDACESMGATFRHKPVGRFGRVGTFSTYFSHHISTLEGGFCVTEDNEFAELMRVLRAHGWTREMKDPGAIRARYADIDPKFLFVNVGYNLRCTELQGAMGMVQLPKLRGYIEQRTELAGVWTAGLVDRYGAFFGFQKPQEHGKHSWFGFPMWVKPDAPFTAREFCTALNDNGIETRVLIAGNIARQPAMNLFDHRVDGDLKHADYAMDHGFTFANHQSVDEGARRHVLSVIEAFMKERGHG